MAGTRSAPVRYSKGGVRADTRKLDQAQKSTDASLTALEAAIAVGHEPIFIETPDDKDYPGLPLNSKFAFTINEVTTKCTAGTATVTIKINGVALGGTANAASTSEQTQTHTTANAVAVGDDVTVTVSSNSGCENLAINYKYTRTL